MKNVARVPVHPALPGRATETAVVQRLLDTARAGRSAALVVGGEAGIGKSTLLRHAAAAAPDMLVLTRTGVETETELPFAALHLLLKDTMAGVDELPGAQADALRAALGLATAERAPDRFLVGLAVLTLLAELAAQRPVLCLLDDAHWFDRASAQVLLFVARRLDAEAVVMIFAARTGHVPAFPAPGLAELTLPRLDETTARHVLDSGAGDLPRHIREQLLREAAGNPLALHELPAAHRAGRAPVYPLGPPEAGRGGSAPTHSPVEREFAARIAALPDSVRTVLLVAAADNTCDTGVVLAAAQRLGSSAADLEAAERARLLMFQEGCLGFWHPLIRTAAYGSATVVAKQEAHRALADVLDGRPDVDRRNWHRAAASIGPDEDVAAALEESARGAADRGSNEGAAAAYERAGSLSPDPARRTGRLTAAAEAAADAGHREWAATLAVDAARPVADRVQLARLALIHARLADEVNRPEETHRLLMEAVVPTAAVAPGLADEMLLWAVEAGWSARDRGMVEQVVAAADRLGDARYVRALSAVALAQLPGSDDTALPGAVAGLREMAICHDSGSPRVGATLAAWHLALGDHVTAHELAAAAERDCRTRGAHGVLPRVLAVLAAGRWHLGHRHDAAAAAAEGLQLARDAGHEQALGELAAVAAQLAAVEGDEVRLAAVLAELDGRRKPRGFSEAAAAARSLLDVGLGRFETAADRLTELVAHPSRRQSLPDLVEAATRAGRPELARDAAARFERWAGHVGQDWARAVALRCRALVDGGDRAERLFAEAVAHHRLDGARPFERARTELLHGELLRRGRRRAHARAPLRSALETFEELGARPWAERARAELRATGESRADAQPGPDLLTELTPQELQVVRLAAAGLSNRDIGAQLFLSPRTVGYHLYKAFPKLGVTSRAQLVRLDLPA
ncbi:helix-turn-helix transcriptional regulator [Pseudonocardia xinjiangensis]|uniref:helix-turn-helix transcriptional regulator n=1 Tax=Pseudonocardia xinjiangensis TaxID=75289 RepID=UPI003D90ECC1